MGRVTFTQENVVDTGDSFPRLKLEKGDVKRCVCLENPHAEWVHNLRAPKIVNGRPVMTKMKSQNGEEYDAYVYDFIGAPICLGDEGILAEKFFDPDNCPACKDSEEGDRIRKPQRRFAMNVMEYTNVNKQGQVIEPFGVRTVVWGFTDTVFGKLVGFAQEYSGGLPKHDLILGPCEDKQFQKFNIMASEKAEWLVTPERKALTIQTFQSNKAENLAQYCGAKKEKAWFIDAVKRIKGRWDIVNGTVAVGGGQIVTMSTGGSQVSLEQGLDGLLADMAGTGMVNSGSKPASAPAQSADVDLDDLLGNTAAKPAAAPQAPSSPADDALANMEPEEQLPPAPKPGSSGETLDFEKMLEGLGN